MFYLLVFFIFLQFHTVPKNLAVQLDCWNLKLWSKAFSIRFNTEEPIDATSVVISKLLLVATEEEATASLGTAEEIREVAVFTTI